MITRLSNVAHTQTLAVKQNKQGINKETKNNNSKPNFKGLFSVGTSVLNSLNTNPAVGACFVDFFSMVTPRTLVDLGRSKDAGLETGIRESSGTINHALAGLVGLGAGYLVSSAFNKANGVKAHLMFMDGNTIDTFKDFVKGSETASGYDSKKYWNSFFKSLEGFNTTGTNQAWTGLSEDTVNRATEIMVNSGTNKYKVPKEAGAKIAEMIIGETGAGSTLKINTPSGVANGTEGALKDLLGNANAMLKAVKDKATKDNTAIVGDLENFLKGVKNKKIATVGAGLAIPVIIGMSAQPVNRYLTKKRTGNDGFVGVEGRKPDHSLGFKVLKAVTAVGIGSAMIATILKNPKELYTNIGKASKEILGKLQYKGMVPTINQFKFIYGVTIMSRFLAARDKNELREASIKDTLGFANWLILGGFVSKLASKAFNKNLINYDKSANGEGVWNFILKSVEKTHEEILYPTLKKLGINVIDENGKVIKFQKLVKIMGQKLESPDVSDELKTLIKETNSRLKYKNAAQALGYIYSGVVLGYGIPKLNIAITKYFDKNNKADNNIQDDKMRLSEFALNSDNKTFSAFGAYLK